MEKHDRLTKKSSTPEMAKKTFALVEQNELDKADRAVRCSTVAKEGVALTSA